VPKTLERDMLSKPFHEVEEMIKETRQHDLSLSHMATISGIRGKQFGREIFSTVLKFKDLMSFLEVFPNVQRKIVPRRVTKIKNYVLSGLENKKNMRFFSSLTVTARGNIFYDESTQKVAINTHESRLSINDGQHRFYGISEAIRELQGRINKAKTRKARDKAVEMIEELKEMIVPIVIFNNLTEQEEKQLFHDLNNLSQRPSRSANIKLVQTDMIAKIARELSIENKYLKHYGVEVDKMSIQKNNSNTILLTTIYSMIKLMYWNSYKYDNNFINEDNIQEYKEKVNDTLSELFYTLPPDINVKGKYILEKNYALRGIAKFIHHCRNDLRIEDKYTFEAIGKVDWSTNMKFWELYGAFPSKKGLIQFAGNGEGGITAVFMACSDKLKHHKQSELFEENNE
jgi:DNA sulfur modification protein DndB